MALLDILTPEIVAERFYTLPQVLQGALENKDNRREVQIACVTNGVGDPNDLQGAEAIMAAVMLGLTHMDDLKETLAENLSLDLQTAIKIAAEVRDKVLEPLRKEIEKIYAPIGAMPARLVAVALPPAPVKAPVVAPKPAPMPMASMPAPKMPTPAVMPITPPAGTTGAPTQPWQPARLVVPVTPTTPVIPTTPAPFMMHQEASATPLAPGSDFKLNISKDMFKSTPTRPVDIPRPPKTAELEIGKAPLPPQPPGITSFRITPAAQSRIVHYTDLRTTVAPGFGAAQPAATPIAPSMPAATAPIAIKPPIVPPMNIAPKPPTPIIAAPTPTAPAPIVPLPPKPPKVVNFGPEEVK